MEELNIGMTFSGGGYRAATFDLGTLSLMNSIRLDDGRTLLDCVSVLTSVSGGTITAMKYMLARARGQAVDEMVKEVFTFLCTEDLVTDALQQMSAEKANRSASAIKMMAGIYDSRLFGGAEIGEIIEHFDRIPVKDYTALATDFDNSLPFRFRLTEGVMTDGARMSYGVFGNQKHSISRSLVGHITPGEALACSSCFPSGFEPMMFPDDFKVSQRDDFVADDNKRFGLMDGGIVDNQGIEPLLLAEKRRRKYRADKTRTDKALDLVLISDVASPYMEGYTPCEQKISDGVGKLTLGHLRNYGLIAEAVSAALFAVSLLLGSNFWTGVMSVILALVTAANVVGMVFKRKMFEAIRKTFVGDRASFISHLKFASLESLLMNRAKSILMMSSEVFLKRLRQMSYENISRQCAGKAVPTTGRCPKGWLPARRSSKSAPVPPTWAPPCGLPRRIRPLECRKTCLPPGSLPLATICCSISTTLSKTPPISPTDIGSSCPANPNCWPPGTASRKTPTAWCRSCNGIHFTPSSH